MYSPSELKELTDRAVGSQSRQAYLEGAIDALAEFCLTKPTAWMQFGPFWPNVEALIRDRVDTSAWQTTSDERRLLARYRIADPAIAAATALVYLEREGEYLAPNETAHEIQLPNGEYASYVPGVGIMEY
ncbi:MAG TPA: hypothetical protein V6C46_10250 [Coleofasciculaceae cyanobacterium]